MPFEIELAHELSNLPDPDELLNTFARQMTRGVADHTRRTLKGSGPLAVREDTGLLKDGLRIQGRPNQGITGSGTIGHIDIQLTGEHGSGRAGAFTLPLVREDVEKYTRSPLTDAAVERIARESWDAAIAAHNEDR